MIIELSGRPTSFAAASALGSKWGSTKRYVAPDVRSECASSKGVEKEDPVSTNDLASEKPKKKKAKHVSFSSDVKDTEEGIKGIKNSKESPKKKSKSKDQNTNPSLTGLPRPEEDSALSDKARSGE